MIASAQRVAFEDLRSLGFASIGSGYTAVGAAFANPVRILEIENTTDINLIISFDGVHDKTFIAANSFKIYDYDSNRNDMGGNFEQPKGTTLYVKQETVTAATKGNVYVTVIYASAN